MYAWKIFKTKVDEFSTNYGHPSGIPLDWNGRVYGGMFNPVSFVLSIILYVISVIPFTISILTIFLIKSLPFFIRVWVETWEKISIAIAKKEFTKKVKEYAQWKILERCKKDITSFADSIKCLSPAKLGKLINSYLTDFSPCKLIPKDIGLGIICLWFPIIIVFMMWFVGLLLVLTIPPLTFLTFLVLWILTWPLVIIFRQR